MPANDVSKISWSSGSPNILNITSSNTRASTFGTFSCEGVFESTNLKGCIRVNFGLGEGASWTVCSLELRVYRSNIGNKDVSSLKVKNDGKYLKPIL